METRDMKKAIIEFSESFASDAIIPSQLPQLLEFLCVADLSSQLNDLKHSALETESVAPFTTEFLYGEKSIYDRLIAVHLLSYCLYYHSAIPQYYLYLICSYLGKDWNESRYHEMMNVMKKFTIEEDTILIDLYIERSKLLKVDSLDATQVDTIMDLNEKDIASVYKLQTFKKEELEYRIMLLVLYNVFLKSVINIISLHISSESSFDSPVKNLGSLIAANSSYIFPCVKEDVLEISIQKTVYSGRDCYPLIVLDNKRVFSDLFRSEKRGTDQEQDMNVLDSQCTYAQMYRAFKKININVLRAKLDSKDRLIIVKYQGEQGLDWGGIFRDTLERWYVCLS